jgi:hypothetical protein
MANQDLLYSILPRPPITPGSGDFGHDVASIHRTPVSREVESHKDPLEHAPQDEYHPSHSGSGGAEEDKQEAPEHNQKKPEADGEHVDLFV